ncbi:hypothetical protein [Paracoccus sanguinis]|uniref:hypothetical protein n=1 Tax=Paracoccus sanguinis TaxID=1545044 RepID=UPI001B8D45F1|nr:hypothetical protein [Paracoccus sanguinis]
MNPEDEAAYGGPSSAARAGFDWAYRITSGDSACNGPCHAVQANGSNPPRAAVLTAEVGQGVLRGEVQQTLASIPPLAEAERAETSMSGAACGTVFHEWAPMAKRPGAATRLATFPASKRTTRHRWPTRPATVAARAARTSAS